MPNSPMLEAFPRRPLKPKIPPGYARKRLFGLVLVLLLILPSIYLFLKVAHEDSLRSDLRARGVDTQVLSSQGRCTSRRQISGDQPLGCNLEISYRPLRAHGGDVRTADVWLDGSAPRVFTPSAIYDPEDPSRVMLKPEVERDAELDEFILAIVLLVLPAGALLLWFASGQRRLAGAARDPRPQLVPIERMVPSQHWTEYWVRPEGSEEAVRTMLSSRQRPFLVQPPESDSAQHAWALVLLDRKDRPVMLDGELDLLDFTADEKEALRAAAYG